MTLNNLKKIAEDAFMDEFDKLSSIGSSAKTLMMEMKGALPRGTAVAEAGRGGVKGGRVIGLSNSLGFGAAEGNVSAIPKSPGAKFGPNNTNSKLYN